MCERGNVNTPIRECLKEPTPTPSSKRELSSPITPEDYIVKKTRTRTDMLETEILTKEDEGEGSSCMESSQEQTQSVTINKT